ncbi:MAG: radical SAM/SPASM domain-containing protein [Candidatus Aenigmatarchaeota archaeon]
MNEEIERLRKWADGNPQPPVGIELAPTLRCNLNCKFCWRRKDDFKKTDEELRKNEMSLGKYKKIIREARDMDVKEVRIIGGGEPLFRQDTIDIMKKIKEEGLYGYICTNGSLFTNEEIEILKSIGWDHVKFSLHGLKKTHNDLVEREVFDKVIENLQRFSNSDVKVEVGMVVVNKNYDEIGEMLKLVEDMNVDFFFLEPITVYSKIGENLTLAENEEKKLRNMIRKVKNTTEKWGIVNNFEEFIRNNLVNKTSKMKEFILSKIDKESESFAQLPCYEPFLRMGIRVDGRVAPCGFYDQERGDSVKNKSLEEVWYGNYFEERRKEQINKKLPDYCSKCCTTLVNKQMCIREKLGEVI